MRHRYPLPSGIGSRALSIPPTARYEFDPDPGHPTMAQVLMKAPGSRRWRVWRSRPGRSALRSCARAAVLCVPARWAASGGRDLDDTDPTDLAARGGFFVELGGVHLNTPPRLLAATPRPVTIAYPTLLGCGHRAGCTHGRRVGPSHLARSRSVALPCRRARQPMRSRRAMSGDPHGEVGGDGEPVEDPADGAVTGAVEDETGGDRCHDHGPAGDRCRWPPAAGPGASGSRVDGVGGELPGGLKHGGAGRVDQDLAGDHHRRDRLVPTGESPDGRGCGRVLPDVHLGSPHTQLSEPPTQPGAVRAAWTPVDGDPSGRRGGRTLHDHITRRDVSVIPPFLRADTQLPVVGPVTDRLRGERHQRRRPSNQDGNPPAGAWLWGLCTAAGLNLGQPGGRTPPDAAVSARPSQRRQPADRAGRRRHQRHGQVVLHRRSNRGSLRLGGPRRHHHLGHQRRLRVRHHPDRDRRLEYPRKVFSSRPPPRPPTASLTSATTTATSTSSEPPTAT